VSYRGRRQVWVNREPFLRLQEKIRSNSWGRRGKQLGRSTKKYEGYARRKSERQKSSLNST